MKEQIDALEAAIEYCSTVGNTLLKDAEQNDKELFLRNAQELLDQLNGKGYSNMVIFGTAFVAMESMFKEFGRSMAEYDAKRDS